MNEYAFFKKKQDTKALLDKHYVQDMLFLTQMILMLHAKQNQHQHARERLHKLICYLMLRRYHRKQKRKLQTESFWQHKRHQDDAALKNINYNHFK